MMAKVKLRFLTLLWAACIMTGAIIRGYRMGARLQSTGFVHIALHVAVFAVLGLLVMLSFDTPGAQLLAVSLSIALGLGTEFYEHFAFQSSMEYGDVVTDAFGVIIGAASMVLRRPSMV
jgi:hypothetical protein